jgi:endonuclease/exonuclease/phosphatase (EEP) superfamily protein YafD
MTRLPDSRIGYATSVNDAYRLPFAVTHLSNGAAKSATRGQRLDRLMGWLNGFGEPRLLVGDFNAPPDAAEMRTVTTSYREGWAEAQSTGLAVGTPFGRRSNRIDFIFYSPASTLTLQPRSSWTRSR